ncbi:putative nuclease HARBI1 [Cydia pomonella]|uniref:putative nuclease HARBI1 n=1 Tax=Cydia pomonella TaxID=82600 RepID=UPI002ADE7E1A|nr:putative nuclease HARBI1 [Cydia pomonella]
MYSEEDALLLASTVLLVLLLRRRKRRRFWMRPFFKAKDRLSYPNDILNSGFLDAYRMSNSDIEKLLNMVAPTIAKMDTNYRQSISPKSRLLITLRFLASGDSYQSLVLTFKVSQQSISCIIPEVCSALISSLRDYIQVPSTEEGWLNIAKDFELLWNFPHCLGALDGKHINMRAPNNSGSTYFNYKGVHSIVLMAVVDANYNFIYCDIGCQGRISDGGVFGNTILNSMNLRGIPKESALPGRSCLTPYVFIADNAFPISENLMKPFLELGRKGSKVRIFNYRLSRARRMVESTFGILSAVFRCLRRPFHLQPKNVENIVLATTYLHNYLRRNCESYRSLQLRYSNITSADSEIIQPPEIQSPVQFYSLPTPAELVREEFAEYFCSKDGMVTWQYKYC